VWHWNGSAWVQDSDQRFVWDGWLMVMTVNSGGTPQEKYTWGLDLSGLGGLGVSSSGIHGAGGIGGLLAMGVGSGGYWYVYDGNGNVGQIIDGAYPEIAVAYEYDPYGNALRLDDFNSFGIVWYNPFRFSTKWFDCLGSDGGYNPPGNGLCYYGYRYYSPRLGRWLSRDPIEAEGGMNLYGFARNAPTFRHDPKGREAFKNPADMATPPPPGWQILTTSGNLIAKKYGYTVTVSIEAGSCAKEGEQLRGCLGCHQRCKWKCTGIQLCIYARKKGTAGPSSSCCGQIGATGTICNDGFVPCLLGNVILFSCEPGPHDLAGGPGPPHCVGDDPVIKAIEAGWGMIIGIIGIH
jgi:RHS repeat-associated protein